MEGSTKVAEDRVSESPWSCVGAAGVTGAVRVLLRNAAVHAASAQEGKTRAAVHAQARDLQVEGPSRS